MKKLSILLTTLVLFAGCTTQAPSPGSSDEQAGTSKEKIHIVASFYPLAEFSRQVAGDLAEVTSVTPTGADPHEYEPTPRQIAEARSADLFIYNGAGQDPWAEKLATDLKEDGIEVIEMTSHFTLLEHGEEEEHEHEEEEHEHEEEEHEHEEEEHEHEEEEHEHEEEEHEHEEEEHEHEEEEHEHEEEEHEHEEEEHEHEEEEHHHDLDPHIWLDPMLAIRQVEAIRDVVVKIDPSNEGIYQSNTGRFMNELLAIHDSFEEGLANCAKEEIITAHAAYGYMAARYNFHQISIAGLSTEEEPSARRLAELADLAEAENIKYIFFEELVGPRLSETLANEVGAQTLVLNPIEGLTNDQMEAGENYGTLMQANLDNLRIALECE